ncbi:MAG: ATP-binding protein [Abditibacteriota bacterium]|nr:ATP-binding protein [Abditibacteriota bacterium]
MGYISRHMESRITELSRYYSVILLTGPRQSGKTTMLRRLAEKEGAGRRYVTLDDMGERELAKNDPSMFLQLHMPPVLIDEVQYAPELFAVIKSYADRHQNPGDFWLTGSQVFRLMRGVRESLAGRAALLSLSSLSQREMTGAACVPFTADADRLLAESGTMEPVDTPSLYVRMWKGSMPGLIGGHTPDRNVFYSSYVSTYVERDVRQLSGGVDALKFSRFVTAAAARCSQLLNYNALAEDAGVSVQTAKGWMDILETLGVVFLLHPYSNNVLKRTVKTPKVYFFDTGLVCYLTRWSSPEAAEAGAMNGALLENFAVSEIVKGYRNAGLEPYLYFYRDRDAKEIDLVLESDGRLCPLEIKKTASPDKRLTRVFGVIDRGPLPRGTGAVICMAERFGAIDREALIVPVWML